MWEPLEKKPCLKSSPTLPFKVVAPEGPLNITLLNEQPIDVGAGGLHECPLHANNQQCRCCLELDLNVDRCLCLPRCLCAVTDHITSSMLPQTISV